MSTEILRVHKMVGAGNDFLFADARTEKEKKKLKRISKKHDRSELARLLCRRHQSFGADGMIFIEKDQEKRSEDLDFVWDFYNSDGSQAEMCGNASRCAILYAHEILKIKKKWVKFQTLSGDVRGRLLKNHRVQIYLASPKLLHEGLEVKVGETCWVGTSINAGVPQFVVDAKFKNVSDLNKNAAREIQKHQIFGDQQTNVTFLNTLGKNRARAVTYERGVQDFTLACGTGAIAAAFALAEKTKTQDFVHIEMPGGQLSVKFENEETTCLEGEALLLGEGLVFEESLL